MILFCVSQENCQLLPNLAYYFAWQALVLHISISLTIEASKSKEHAQESKQVEEEEDITHFGITGRHTNLKMQRAEAIDTMSSQFIHLIISLVVEYNGNGSSLLRFYSYHYCTLYFVLHVSCFASLYYYGTILFSSASGKRKEQEDSTPRFFLSYAGVWHWCFRGVLELPLKQ